MEDFSMIFAWLGSLHPAIPMVLAGLGGLVVLAQVVVSLTPTPSDNEFMAKLESIPVLGSVLKGLKALAPIKKKDE